MVSAFRSSLAYLCFSPACSLSSIKSTRRGGLLNRLPRRSLFVTTGSILTAAASHNAFAFGANPVTSPTTTTCDSSSSTTTTTTTQRNMMSSSSGGGDNDLTGMSGYLNAADAAALDAELMSSPGFSLEQLMELAGLSVAEAVYQVIDPSATNDQEKKKILLICGPGNNGGDGLVAARHLIFFGYDCVVVYPKRSSKTHFVNLVQQCEDVDIPIVDEIPDDMTPYDGIVDAIFGFSFKGAPREPFATALNKMQEAQTKHNIPVLSVDVPSGWNVDEGDVAGTGFVPQVLISLTTPKNSAKGFTGRHFVGGRFLPPKLAEKYNVKMPPYPGVSQVMEVSSSPSSTTTEGESTSKNDEEGWEAEYAAYLESKYNKQVAEEETTDDPTSSSSAATLKVQDESTLTTTTWEAQYAAYCAQKEKRLAEEDAKLIAAMKEKATLE